MVNSGLLATNPGHIYLEESLPSGNLGGTIKQLPVNWIAVVAGLMAASAASAGGMLWDLNDPGQTNDIILRGNGAAWGQESDGNGCLQITPAAGHRTGTILFPDFEEGLVIKAFTFECDVKLGDGTNPPAEGFSLNYAHPQDPVVQDILAGGDGEGFAGTQDNGADETGLPEEGTTTGLAIGFDLQPGNGPADLRGISVRINGTQTYQFPLPDLLVDQPTADPALPSSLETGPGGGGTGTNLTWQPFKAQIDELGVVNLWWKNVQVLTNFQSEFYPIAGRIVFSGSTSDNHVHQFVDNIRITTVPSTTYFEWLWGHAGGFEVTLNVDSGSVLAADTIQLALNGTNLATSSYIVSKIGDIYRFSYGSLPDFLPPGSSNLVAFSALDTEGFAYNWSGWFQVRRYLALDPSWRAGAGDYDPTTPGFVGRINQIAVARTPGDANQHWNAARQLAGGYLDPATGEAYPNLVSQGDGAGGVDAEGNFELPDGAVYEKPWININQDVLADPPTERGEFTSEVDPRFRDDPIPGIPGITGSTDHIVMEAFSYVQLEAPRLYTFLVNSDEGFRASFGPQLHSVLNTDFEVSQFSGGKSASNVQFDVVTLAGGAGVYRIRLLWWEGSGEASCELYSLTGPFSRALVGDVDGGGLPAYKPMGAGQSFEPELVSVAPWPGQTEVAPDTEIQVIFADGTDAVVDAGSIRVLLNDTEPPKTSVKVGDKTRVTVTPTALLGSGALNTIDLEFTAGGESRTASYAFTTATYATIPAFLGTAPGTATEAGMLWRTYQIATSHGTTIDVAEEVLAGNLGPDIHDPNGYTTSQGVDGCFRIPEINFDQDPSGAGNFHAGADAPLNVADEGIPGIPGTTGSTDNISAEALTLLELNSGLYRMVVNSDDGFEVTVGTKDQPKYLSLGRFDGGRGAVDTQFYFSIDDVGVYLFRLLWFEGGGQAGVEWFTIDRGGNRALVGGGQIGSIPALRIRTVSEPVIPEVAFDPPTVSATGEVTLTWSDSGTLQESADLINWWDVSPEPAGNNHTVAPDAAGKVRLYRIRVQP